MRKGAALALIEPSKVYLSTSLLCEHPLAGDLPDVARIQEHLMSEAVLQAGKLGPVPIVDIQNRLELFLRGRDQPDLSAPYLAEALDDALQVPDARDVARGVLA